MRLAFGEVWQGGKSIYCCMPVFEASVGYQLSAGEGMHAISVDRTGSSGLLGDSPLTCWR
jgi:hypothetical protein